MPIPQEIFVPVNRSKSRRYHSNGMSGSPLNCRATPLTFNCTIRFSPELTNFQEHPHTLELRPPCFEDVLEFRDGGHPTGEHDLAVDHHGRRSHDAEIQNVCDVRHVRDVGCEIEFSAGVDDIPFRILAIGATWPRDLNLHSCT